MSQSGKDFAFNVMITGAVIAFVLPLLALAAMCVVWLNTGEWPQWTLVSFGLEPPVTSMLGLNKLLAFVYEQQAAALTFAGGMLLAFAGIGLEKINGE